jgi:hypothetical protein
MVSRWWPERAERSAVHRRALSHDEWAQRLADRFFPAVSASHPVRFAVDDDTLDEIAEADGGEGARELAAVVRPKLRRQDPRHLYEDILGTALSWSANGSTGVPPFLPCLAVCVLAAARMDADTGMSAANYYKRLHAVLDIDESVSAGYGDAIPSLFRLLHEWLFRVNRGRRGRSTIPDIPTLAYIGFALSQVKFRESDRRKLTRFFGLLGLKNHDASSAPLLVPRLRHWARNSDLSATAKSFVSNEEYRADLIALLSGELADWDETERDEQGRRLGVLRLLLDVERKPKWGVLASRPSGFPEAASFTSQDGHSLPLVSSVDGFYDPVWFAEANLSLFLSALARPAMFRADHWALRFAIDPVTPLQPDELTGKLAAVRRVDPGERHWVLIRADLATAATDLLGEIAREGWSERPECAPIGWLLLSNVIIDLPPRNSVPEALEPLVPAVDARPELRGGLPFDRRQGVREYLTGGEPDLWIPEWMSADTDLPISVDGKRFDHALPRIELCRLNLPVGLHTIEVGPSAIRFATVPFVRSEPPGPEEACRVVVHPARADADSVPPGTEPVGEWVCGAVVHGLADRPFHDPRQLLLPYGARRYVVIGPQVGDVAECRQPGCPEWLETIDILPKDFEVYPKFDPSWVAIEWAFRGWELRNLSPKAPTEGVALPEARRKWADDVIEAGGASKYPATALWDVYLAAAQAIVEEEA